MTKQEIIDYMYENHVQGDFKIEEMAEDLAQPRKGKWIYGESEIGNDGYYCSVCGNFVPWKYGEYDIDFIKEFLFCNKCGADMREGDAE